MKRRSANQAHTLDDNRALRSLITARVAVKTGIPALACGLLLAPLPAAAIDGCVTIGFDDPANTIFEENGVSVYEEQGVRFEADCLADTEGCQFEIGILSFAGRVLFANHDVTITLPDGNGDQQSFDASSFDCIMAPGQFEECDVNGENCVSIDQSVTLNSSKADNLTIPQCGNPGIGGNLDEKTLQWDNISSISTDSSIQTKPLISDNWTICPDSDDADNDGVLDTADVCPGTVLPETPTDRLKKHRWMDTDGDNQFETEKKKKDKKGDALIFTLADTAGCSCTQIAEITESEKHADKIAEDPSKLDKYMKKHLKHGCKTKLMQEWIDSLQ